MRKRLIINADDYGLTSGCCSAIDAAVAAGAVTSVSSIVWRKNRQIKGSLKPWRGIHLRLTDGEPVLASSAVPSLINPATGEFYRSQQEVAMQMIDQDQVCAEWKAQISRYIEAAGMPTHLDTHKHTHELPNLWEIYADLCAQNGCAGVPLSWRQKEELRARGVKTADYTEIRWTDGSPDTLCRLLLQDFERHETVHLMCHPGLNDPALRAVSTMTSVRAVEFNVLMGGIFRKFLESQEIQRMSYSDLDPPEPAHAQVDILYLAWNRKEYTQASLNALLLNTRWENVRRLYLYDDGSTDGTLELLEHFTHLMPKNLPAMLVKTKLRSPVAIMNHFLTNFRPAPWFVKIDNDVVLPPGWLETGLEMLRWNPELDLLGLEAKYQPVDAWCTEDGRKAVVTDHIGGVGFMRSAAFEDLPVADGRLGFSDWQIKHDVNKAWLDPSLPVILLDRLPIEPWLSLGEMYQAQGWQRPWRHDADPNLWNWWLKK